MCLRIVLATFPVLLSVAHAQGVAPPQPSSNLHSSATLVTVPTLVQSPSGDLVTTLNASDFRLTDNTVPQKLSLDHIDRQPLAITVLLQTGGAAASQFPKYTGLGAMLEGIVGASSHRVSLVTFDSRPEEAWDFTPNIADLEDGFKRPVVGDDGAAILDAIGVGIDLLQAQPVGVRRILLLVSQVHDGGSKARLDDIVRRLGENDITVEALTFPPQKTWIKDQFTKPRHGNPPYQLSPLSQPLIGTFDLGTPLAVALGALRSDTAATAASLSGGESMHFGTRAEFEAKLAMLANNVHNRYALSFSPSSRQSGFHAIEVTVPTQPTFKVAARTSYWSETKPLPQPTP